MLRVPRIRRIRQRPYLADERQQATILHLTKAVGAANNIEQVWLSTFFVIAAGRSLRKYGNTYTQRATNISQRLIALEI